jgi:hypothetical protein
MTDREIMQQALDALNSPNFGVHSRAILALQERLAHCDRCGKKLGGEGDIHTCTPDPIGDAQDRLIAELAAQPEREPVGSFMTREQAIEFCRRRRPSIEPTEQHIDRTIDAYAALFGDLVPTPPQQEIDALRAAITKTLNENGHLADGDNCTLIHLKKAMGLP